MTNFKQGNKNLAFTGVISDVIFSKETVFTYLLPVLLKTNFFLKEENRSVLYCSPGSAINPLYVLESFFLLFGPLSSV